MATACLAHPLKILGSDSAILVATFNWYKDCHVIAYYMSTYTATCSMAQTIICWTLTVECF
jgi:hypothetical protein